jgi:hypothetical protein
MKSNIVFLSAQSLMLRPLRSDALGVNTHNRIGIKPMYKRFILVVLFSVSLLVGCAEKEEENCNYRDNLGEIAESYISCCRKASIRREFPSQHYYLTLAEIKSDRSGNGRKAYKLLNDGRFTK